MRGQVEIAQAENAAAMFTQAIMDYSLNGRVQQTIGNRDIFGRFPCGVYPAKSPGTSETMEDHWVSIHCTTDPEWDALAQVMGNPEWARDPKYATNDGRAKHYRELDEQIGRSSPDAESTTLASTERAWTSSPIHVIVKATARPSSNLRSAGARISGQTNPREE